MRHFIVLHINYLGKVEVDFYVNDYQIAAHYYQDIELALDAIHPMMFNWDVHVR